MATLRSIVWGNQPAEISQGYGVNSPDVPDEWYAYAAQLGLNYGEHAGLDISLEKGTTLYALNPGKVSFAGWSDSFRPMPVIVETADDPATRADESGAQEIYGHLWQDFVSAGDKVQVGQKLGLSGEQTVKGTWNPDGSGPHLHFERRKYVPVSPDRPGGQEAQDPTSWLEKTAPVSSRGEDAEPTPAGSATATPTAGPTGALAILAALQAFLPRAILLILGALVVILGVWGVSGAEIGKSPLGRVRRALRG